MSLRIFINNELKGGTNLASERIIRNLENQARQIGTSLAVQYAKKAVYDAILPEAIDDTDQDSRLEIKPLYSPYKTSDSRKPVRNAIVFQTNDKSVKVFIYDAKIDITPENTIVKTPVTKRKGTIKEFISAKDYAISIVGNLISDSQYGFPIIELREVIKLFNEEQNIEVFSVLLSQFEINKVVLESANISQSSARYVNAIPFNMRLVSDEDYELTIEEEK